MQPIEATAEALGIEPRYWDISGVEHIASSEVLQAIMTSLGPVSDLERPVAPTFVIGQDTRELPVGLPDGPVPVILEWESGERVAAQAQVAQGQVRLPSTDLPLGYHSISIGTARAHLIVCPERTFQPEWLSDLETPGRAGGLSISLYGVRSARNWGCGDFTDLERIIDWAVADTGASFIGLNPLHAIPNRQPYNTSPYLPNSSFYRNFIYLDLERIPGFAWPEELQGEIAGLRDATFVEYEKVAGLKLRCLKVLFRAFLERGGDFELEAYVEREGRLLHLYALYCALDESLHEANPEVWNWRSWPVPFQSPESAETLEFAKEHWRSVLFYQYIQWQIDLQLRRAQEYAKERGLAIGLYHDLALATDSFGSDLWAHRPFYVGGCRVGSPPDNFSPKGQDWGFPPPNSVHHYEDGYRLFAESVRKNSAHGGALRIDHVMRFFRLYWIPEGMDTGKGTYVRDRYEDLLRILALESVRGQFLVIGEDLGTVPDYVRETLKRFGVLSYRLLYFEQDEARQFRTVDEYPRQALVSASTHDLPTLAGFWQNRDIEARLAAGVIPQEALEAMVEERGVEKQKMLDLLHRMGLLPGGFARDASGLAELTPELHNAIIGFLCSTPCELMALNQEDLFKETEQQNLPGTTAEYPNWRRKMRYTVEELGAGVARPFTLMWSDWLARTGRDKLKHVPRYMK